MRISVYLTLIITACVLSIGSRAAMLPIKVAVLDFGATSTGSSAADGISRSFSSNRALQVIDRDESRAAAGGNGYSGSLNLTLEEARVLGEAIGCDFYLTGDAQTIRRSSFERAVYYEAYASIFIVSARTGRLIIWDRPSFEASSPEAAEKMLMAELDERTARYASAIEKAMDHERSEREVGRTPAVPMIEDVPDEGSPQAQGLRLPHPYRRLRPVYPVTAARAEAEATVDVLVDIDAEGEVSRVEVVRWAGFGLDEETVKTVRQMHFRPAMRDGVPLPMRVLLRYNFQRPKVEKNQ